MVAGSASGNGAFHSILRFDLSTGVTQFNSAYGAGNWTITSITLRLAGNNGVVGQQPNNAMFPVIAAGNFTLSWTPNDSWSEGSGSPSVPTTDGVVFNDLPTLTAGSVLLGNFSYTPPGNNVPLTWSLSLAPSLTADVAAGGAVSFLVAPGDENVSYLFNSRSFGTVGNRPLLSVTVIPEPSIAALLALAGAAFLIGRRRL